ncbi:MAG: hypothetical protein ACP5K7_14500 [Verrucomicrobiia bacterium]
MRIILKELRKPKSEKVTRAICVAVLFFAIGIARADSITNVVVANVTPSMFTVIWRAPQSVPGLNVYADANGNTNLQGEVGIEYFPLHTGSPSAVNAYFRRESKTQIRQRIEQSGYYIVRVLNCKPDTTYYFNISARLTNGQTIVYPPNGLLSVKTAKTNSFLLDSRQLIVNIPGTNTLGRVLTLSHTNAAYPLVAVVGDGCPSNNAVFNLGELFAVAGGNFSPDGSQQFVVSLLGDGEEVVQEFAIDFTNAFSVASLSGLTISGGYEQLVVDISQTIVNSGQSGSIRLSIETTTPLTNLQIAVQMPSGLLLNPAFGSVSPLIDNTSAARQAQNGVWTVKLPVKSGSVLSGVMADVATINFSAASGLSSTIITPVVSDIQGTKTNGGFVANVFARVGRIVIVGQQPVLEARLGADGSRRLIIYGTSGATYQIQSTTVLETPQGWGVVAEVTITNSTPTIIPLTYQNEQAIFYRALEISPIKIGSSISDSSNSSITEKNKSQPVKVLPKIQYKVY